MIKPVCLIIGVSLGLLIDGLQPIGNNVAANETLAVAAVMVVWWLTNAIHFALTALLPLIIFPLADIIPWSAVFGAYVNRIMGLFLGGFMLAAAIEKWQLHRRLALQIVMRVGTNPKRIILGFMIACASMSMWLTNTATTLMMLPIGLSVIQFLNNQRAGGIPPQFGSALLLSIAYSSSIGGMATIIGTTPNAFSVAFLAQKYDIQVDFLTWLSFGLPFIMFALPLCYLTLTRLCFSISELENRLSVEPIRQSLNQLGCMSWAEKWTAAVFAVVVFGWISLPWLVGKNLYLNDATMALSGGVLLMLIPSKQKGMLLQWRDIPKLPWSLLILFAGGLLLAAAISQSGLAISIAHMPIFLVPWSFPVLLFFILTAMILLSELSSNLATTATFIPIMASVAQQQGFNIASVVIPATIAASCAFMLPVATPPNAIVFGSGKLTILQMARAGIALNALMLILLVVSGLILFAITG